MDREKVTLRVYLERGVPSEPLYICIKKYGETSVGGWLSRDFTDDEAAAVRLTVANALGMEVA